MDLNGVTLFTLKYIKSMCNPACVAASTSKVTSSHWV